MNRQRLIYEHNPYSIRNISLFHFLYYCLFKFKNFGRRIKEYNLIDRIDFSDYEQEHMIFKESRAAVVEKLSVNFKCKVIDRSYLPNYIFSEKDLPVVVGQDGLVANTAKYVKGLPIFAINPDNSRYDGVLLPPNMKNLHVHLFLLV